MNLTQTSLENRTGLLIAVESATMAFIFLVSSTGNIISSLIMYRSPRLRTWHNRLLLNVIFVDLLGSVLILPVAFVTLATGTWILGDAVCSLIAYISTVLLTVSIATLATISISRCFLITNLLRYMTIFKKRNISWMLVAIWLLSAVCAFPPFIGWGDFSFLPANAICFVYFGASLSYAAVFTLLVIGLPVVTILVCFIKVRRAVNVNKCIKSSLGFASIVSEEIDSAKTLFFVVIMVLLCWFPMLLVLLLVAFGIKLPRQATLVTTYVVYLPTALKPVIYFCMKRKFRSEFFALFDGLLPRCKRRRNQVAALNLTVKTDTRMYGSEKGIDTPLQQLNAQRESLKI